MSKNQVEKRTKQEIALDTREIISNIEQELLEMVPHSNGNLVDYHDSVHFPLKHTFADGIYVRQMTMNKGSYCIGAIHKDLHVWFLLTGHITVITENNKEDYVAPCYVVAKPGTKRVIGANEDSIFVNIHQNPDNCKDIEMLEDRLTTNSWREYEEYINKKQ